MIKKILPIILTSLVGFRGSAYVEPQYSNTVNHNLDLTPFYYANSYGERYVGNNQYEIYFTYQLPQGTFDYLAYYESIYISLPLWTVNVYDGFYYDYYATFTTYGGYDLHTGLSTPRRHNLSREMTAVYGYTTFSKETISGFNLFDSSNFSNPQTDHLFLSFNLVVDNGYIVRPNNWLQSIRVYNYLPPVVENYETGYNDGYDDGLADGYFGGYVDGKEVGYNDGYVAGDLDGYNRGINDDFNAYSYLFGMFGAFSGLFAVELLPGLTVGGIAILVLSLTLLPFLIGLFTKGGK